MFSPKKKYPIKINNIVLKIFPIKFIVPIPLYCKAIDKQYGTTMPYSINAIIK